VDKITLAEWAQRLLDDDFFKKVMDDLKSAEISAIIGSNMVDVDVREDAYRTIKTIEKIEGHLQSMAAEKQIRDKRFKIL
jgi:hypothetical protein